MKRIFLAAALLALTTATADAGPLRNLVCRAKNHHGPIANAVRHNVAAQPVRTAVGAVIEWPARITEARPIATMFAPKWCPNCK